MSFEDQLAMAAELKSRGRLDAAVRMCRTSVETGTGSRASEAWLLAAEIFREQGKPNEANTCHARAVALGAADGPLPVPVLPDGPMRSNAHRLEGANEGNPGLALWAHETGREMTAVGWLAAGLAYEEAQEDDQSRQAFLRCIDGSLESGAYPFDAWYRLAMGWARAGRPDRALAYLRKEFAASSSPRVMCWVAEILLLDGKTKEAARILADIDESSIDKTRLLGLRARLALASRQFGQAAELGAEAILADPFFTESYLLRAEALLCLDKPEESYDELTTAHHLGDVRAAGLKINAFGSADPAEYAAAAIEAISHGQDDVALSLLDVSLGYFENSIGNELLAFEVGAVRAVRARLLRQQGELDAAEAELKIGEGRGQFVADTECERDLLSLARGHRQRALVQIENLASRSNRYAPAWMALGKGMLAAGRPARALEALEVAFGAELPKGPALKELLSQHRQAMRSLVQGKAGKQIRLPERRTAVAAPTIPTPAGLIATRTKSSIGFREGNATFAVEDIRPNGFAYELEAEGEVVAAGTLPSFAGVAARPLCLEWYVFFENAVTLVEPTSVACHRVWQGADTIVDAKWMTPEVLAIQTLSCLTFVSRHGSALVTLARLNRRGARLSVPGEGRLCRHVGTSIEGLRWTDRGPVSDLGLEPEVTPSKTEAPQRDDTSGLGALAPQSGQSITMSLHPVEAGDVEVAALSAKVEARFGPHAFVLMGESGRYAALQCSKPFVYDRVAFIDDRGQLRNIDRRDDELVGLAISEDGLHGFFSDAHKVLRIDFRSGSVTELWQCPNDEIRAVHDLDDVHLGVVTASRLWIIKHDQERPAVVASEQVQGGKGLVLALRSKALAVLTSGAHPLRVFGFDGERLVELAGFGERVVEAESYRGRCYAFDRARQAYLLENVTSAWQKAFAT